MLQVLFGDPNEKKVTRYTGLVNQINALGTDIKGLSDKDLQDKTIDLTKKINKSSDFKAILPEAFALVREASFRVLGLRHFDVQLIGGMILHEGKIAEMKTGEGKTLVAILPAYLNSLSGLGVHVVTVNDYLAKRDSEWVGQVPKFLGLSVGLVQEGMTQQELTLYVEEEVLPKIERVPGVASVSVSGAYESEVHVVLDDDALAGLNAELEQMYTLALVPAANQLYLDKKVVSAVL